MTPQANRELFDFLNTSNGLPLMEVMLIRPLTSAVVLWGLIPRVVSKIPLLLTDKINKFSGCQSINFGLFFWIGKPTRIIYPSFFFYTGI